MEKKLRVKSRVDDDANVMRRYRGGAASGAIFALFLMLCNVNVQECNKNNRFLLWLVIMDAMVMKIYIFVSQGSLYLVELWGLSGEKAVQLKTVVLQMCSCKLQVELYQYLFENVGRCGSS